jgi:hypothetical protein
MFFISWKLHGISFHLSLTITMMKQIKRSLAMGIAIVAFVTPKSALTQEEAQVCASTARAIANGQLTDTQARVLSGCRHSGPDALARVWLQADLAPKNLELLAEASSMLRDSRLFTVALAATENESAPTAVRIAALRVLISYYSSELWPSTSYLNSGTLGDPIPVTTDRDVQDGSSPLHAASRRETQQALLKLSSNNREKEIAHAATLLRQALAFVDPSNTPVEGNAVVLSAGCGPRVTLKSSADIDLDLRVRVLETNYDQRFVVRGVQKSRNGKLTLALPAGTVVVNFGNKEVARLSNRSAPCPPGLTHH